MMKINPFLQFFLDFRLLWVVGLCFLLCQCATIVSPTGGPPDKTPPRIVKVSPPNETTMFQGRKFTFTFSENMKRSNLQKIFTIDPNLDLSFHAKWSGKKIILNLKDSIPQDITLIIHMDNKLTDLRGNKMTNTYTHAISTGEHIDKATLEIQTYNYDDGTKEEGYQFFLFRDSLYSDKAIYTSKTDTGGNAYFSHLSRGIYYPLFIKKTTFNRQWNQKQEIAQVLHQQKIIVNDDSHIQIDPVFIKTIDTLRPQLTRVVPISRKHYRLHFNKNIVLSDSTQLTMVHSTNSQIYFQAHPLYVDINNPSVLHVAPDSVPHIVDDFYFQIKGITDKANNTYQQSKDTLFFQNANTSSKTPQTLLKPIELETLIDTSYVEFIYSQEIHSSQVIDSLSITEGTTIYQNWPNMIIKYNTIRIYPDSVWETGQKYIFRVFDPKNNTLINFSPTIISHNEYGQLSIKINDLSLSSQNKHILLLEKQEEANQSHRMYSFIDSLYIENVPTGQYIARIFKDINNNHQWDYGNPIPFLQPEPYTMFSVKIHTNFESEIISDFFEHSYRYNN